MQLKPFLIAALLAPSLLSLFSGDSSQAHSGGTNGSGCHNNHRTGDYHCHNDGSSVVPEASGSSGASSSRPNRTTYPSPSSYPLGGSSNRTSGRSIFSPGNVIELSSPSNDSGRPLGTANSPSVSTTPSGATQTLWTVVSVGDGDTVRVSRNGEITTVRLACIDSPELAQSPYGQQSKAQLQNLLSTNSDVALRPVDTDRYDRLVAEIFSQGVNINLSLVQSGHAVAYRRYLSNCDRESYLDAEQIAQKNQAAFWSIPNPVMPWDFRRQNRR